MHIVSNYTEIYSLEEGLAKGRDIYNAPNSVKVSKSQDKLQKI